MKHNNQKRSLFGDFKRFSKLCGKNGKKLWAVGFAGSVISGSLGSICQAQALKYIISGFIDKKQDAFALAFLMIGLSVLAGCLIGPFLRYWQRILICKIIKHMRMMLFNHLTSLPASYFTSRHSGDVMARLNGDIDTFSGACDTVTDFLDTIIPAVILIPYILSLDIRMTGIIVVVGVMFSILMAKIVVPLRNKQKKIRNELSKMSVSVTENVTGFNVTKMFNLEKAFDNRFIESADSLLAVQKKYGYLSAIIGLCQIFIWSSGQAFCGAFGILFVLNKTLSVANLSALISITNNIINVFTDFSSIPIRLQQAFAGVDRIYELLDIVPEPERCIICSPSTDCSGICVENLRFSYDGSTPVLDGVSIRAEKGETIALVGDSGSGKTTLIKILAGLHCAESGGISVFGLPMYDYTLEGLRELIAYVPQNAYVFNGTIKDNISYGKQEPSEQEIVAAATMANADSFILTKPQGYDTQVGERGIQLSGGERQRLAIARAILKEAPILLLDEATSSLDSESELAIQNTLDSLLRKHTSVVVAHRLSTIINADTIYMMQKGKIIASGKHGELLAICPPYAELYYKNFAQQDAG